MARVAACFHGFLRTGGSMWLLARALRRAGYDTVALPTFGYHLAPLEYHADRAAAELSVLAARNPDATIDLVTHSYGGILARATLARLPRPLVRRVVMLSPPNQGARMAAQVRALLPVHRLGWDPLGQLLPGVPGRQPGPRGADVGVLTGGTGGRGFSPWLGADNDGKVRIDEAALPDLADFHVIPVRHALMPYSPTSHAQVLAFLETGRFARTALFSDTGPGDATAP